MLQIRNVTKTFRQGGRIITALDDVSLTIPAGTIFGIAGRSGAGKSTLFRVITALQRPDSGSVEIEGDDLFRLGRRALRERRRRIGIVFQQFNLLHGRTALQNVALPLEFAGVPREKGRARAAELLDLVGLADRAGNYPSQLSGGQKQRVGIARALAAEPTVLLSDEATSALDGETTEQILDLLTQVNRELGVSVVLITHELEILRKRTERVASFEAGRLVEEGRVIDLVSDPQSALGRSLLPRFFSDAPIVGRRALVTLHGEQNSDGFLASLGRDADYLVRSGAVYTVVGEHLSRFELDLPDARAVEALERRRVPDLVTVEYAA
ncbi:MAG: methionine ABC transporter ATP-binding protein [Microbacterium sp.]